MVQRGRKRGDERRERRTRADLKHWPRPRRTRPPQKRASPAERRIIQPPWMSPPRWSLPSARRRPPRKGAVRNAWGLVWAAWRSDSSGISAIVGALRDPRRTGRHLVLCHRFDHWWVDPQGGFRAAGPSNRPAVGEVMEPPKWIVPKLDFSRIRRCGPSRSRYVPQNLRMGSRPPRRTGGTTVVRRPSMPYGDKTTTGCVPLCRCGLAPFHVRIADKFVYDLLFHGVLAFPTFGLLLRALDACRLPRGPMPGDKRPKRQRWHVGDGVQPAEVRRHRDHRDPCDREPTVDATHEHRVALRRRP